MLTKAARDLYDQTFHIMSDDVRKSIECNILYAEHNPDNPSMIEDLKQDLDYMRSLAYNLRQ